jgi:hypothetical protein
MYYSEIYMENLSHISFFFNFFWRIVTSSINLSHHMPFLLLHGWANSSLSRHLVPLHHHYCLSLGQWRIYHNATREGEGLATCFCSPLPLLYTCLKVGGKTWGPSLLFHYETIIFKSYRQRLWRKKMAETLIDLKFMQYVRKYRRAQRKRRQ